MPSPKYPRKPLLDHRSRVVDDRTAELGGAIRGRETAAEARERAERSKRDAEAAAARVRAEEATRLANGELRAGDLARGRAWEVGVDAQLQALGRDVDAADKKLTAAMGAEDTARGALATAMADRDVVAKDKARFEARAAAKALAAEEEQAEEAFRGVRG